MPSLELDHIKFQLNYAELKIWSLFFNWHIDYNYTDNDNEYINHCVNLYKNYLWK